MWRFLCHSCKQRILWCVCTFASARISHVVTKILGFFANHKATKPAINVGPPSACQRNAISMAFRWRVDDGPFIAVFGSSIPLSSKTSFQIWTPFNITFGSAHVDNAISTNTLCTGSFAFGDVGVVCVSSEGSG